MAAIHSKNELARALERERARSDRNSHEFSIIAYDVESFEKDRIDINKIADNIQQRIRCYDELGWLDDSRLAVILPHTSSIQAEMLAQKLADDAFPQGLKIGYSILTYPTHWGKKENPSDLTEQSGMPVELWAKGNEMLTEKLNISNGQVMPPWKRLMDIFGAFCGLCLLSPVFMFLSLLIKTVSPGPVFFKQERIGFLGKKFICWKFRTMHVNNPENVHASYFSNLIKNEQAMKKLDKQDARIIPFGRIIRKTGLDELPQLYNVLMGDMSLIGPRPCIKYEADNYELWQRRRFDTIPGITGLWQVNGKNKTTFNEMMRYDIRYTKKKNILTDTLILFKTLPAVIAQVLDR